MALKSTIFKATLQIADMDRHYYKDMGLTIARHPSETDERMMVRLLAFVCQASETLLFTRGLSADNEPDLWQKGLTGEIETWIDVGQPDEKRIRKACGRAGQVFIFTYGGRSAEIWWQQMENKLQRFSNLSVINLAEDTTRALATLSRRTMELHCTIQDGQIWIAGEDHSVPVDPVIWKDSVPTN